MDSLSPRRVSILFPQELIDYIVDCLYDDKPSLSSCALAARKFVPLCQRYLFGSLTCRGEQGRNPLADIITFFGDHSHLSPYVKEICLTSLSQSERVCLCTLRVDLSTLPCLRALTVCESSLTFNNTCCQQPDESFAHPNISSLTLKDISINGTGPSLVHLLQPFPALQHIHIQNVYMITCGHFIHDDAEAIISRELPHFPMGLSSGLTRLALIATGGWLVAPFAYLLDAFGALGNLQDIRVICHDFNDLYSALRALKASAKSLKRVTFDLDTQFHIQAAGGDEEGPLVYPRMLIFISL